jgi:hypothetical protein
LFCISLTISGLYFDYPTRTVGHILQIASKYVFTLAPNRYAWEKDVAILRSLLK